MSTIVVLGAGPIGAAVTHQLVRDDVVRRVVLVDRAAPVAQGVALDIRQAGPVLGATATADGTSDLSVVLGAQAVVVADRHAGGEWRGDEALSLLGSVRAMNPRALLVCAGAGHAELIEQLVQERNADARWVAGSAPEAARSAAASLIALEAGSGPGDVVVAMIGRPPHQVFPAWDGAAVGGSRATDILPAAAVARLERQMTAIVPGPLALAAAAARVIRHHVHRTPGWVGVFLVPTDRGSVSRGIAVPASIGVTGVRPEWPVLSQRERTRLDTLAQAN